MILGNKVHLVENFHIKLALKFILFKRIGEYLESVYESKLWTASNNTASLAVSCHLLTN